MEFLEEVGVRGRWQAGGRAIMLASLVMKIMYPGTYFELLQRSRKPVQATFNRIVVKICVYRCQQSSAC